jgi:hypothetical protein
MRQQKMNARQLGVGFVGGRFPPARPLGATSQLGDVTDSSGTDTQQLAAINTDRAVATESGRITLHLTHAPMDGTLHVRWNGVDQEPTEWSLTGLTLTFVNVHIKVDDVLTAAYFYYPSDDVFTNLDWGSTGTVLVVADGDMTDYSSPTFDDSGWTVAPAALGYPMSAVPATSWPVASTSTGSVNVGFWLRRTVTALADGVKVTISARVDGQHWLYVDGVLVHSYSGSVAGADPTPSVDVTLNEGDHLIALHVNDDTPDPGLDYVYGDLSVTQR